MASFSQSSAPSGADGRGKGASKGKASVSEGPALPDTTEEVFAGHARDAALDYVVRTYLMPTYQVVLGDPFAAKCVVLAFGSLGCPVCRQFHRDIVPRLHRAVQKRGDVAVILRDYPADPASFRASSQVWQYAQPYGGALMGQAMMQEWVREGKNNQDQELQIRIERALQALRQRPRSPTPYDIRYMPTQARDQVAFQRRQQDKQALNIQDVPAVFVVVKNGPDPSRWTLTRIDDPNEATQWDALLNRQEQAAGGVNPQ